MQCGIEQHFHGPHPLHYPGPGPGARAKGLGLLKKIFMAEPAAILLELGTMYWKVRGGEEGEEVTTRRTRGGGEGRGCREEEEGGEQK